MHAICGGPVVTVPVESMTPLCHLHYDESWTSRSALVKVPRSTITAGRSLYRKS